jgi:hypothetical protein
MNEKTLQRRRRQVALDATSRCAALMREHAGRLLAALPGERMDDGLRETAMVLCRRLEAISDDVDAEIGALQIRLGDVEANDETVAGSLSGIDATWMGVLAGLADVVEKLEDAAEHDPTVEPAFVRYIEAVGVMLQDFQAAKEATQAFRSER